MIECPSLEQLYLMDELAVYYDLIVEWNKKFNLTTLTQRQDVFVKHFLDSLLGVKFFFKKGRVLDIGSGAGLPAIPLKLFLPELDFVLTDSVNKKITFLQHVIEVLGLKNITAVHTRIEDFSQRDFDFVTARAVAPLNVLVEYALPFLKIGGRFLAYKGPEAQIKESSRAIELLGGEVEYIENKKVLDMERNIIIIKKVKPSPLIYPRKQNKPRLNPL